MTEFNRKESTKTVGELYPVLLSKDGQVIDGFHRLEDNPNWKTETLENINSEEKLLLARAISNWHRREVPRKEKEEWINGLAKIYKEQGMADPLAAIIASETGLAERTVRSYLSSEYKQEAQARTAPRPQLRVPASQAIKSQVGGEYGESLVERHREEVRKEALTDPEFIAKAASKIVEIPIETIIEATFEKPDPLTPEQVKEIKGAYKETQDKVEVMRKRPEIQERAKWFKMWSGMGNILSVLEFIFCPVCGKSAPTHLTFKCHPENNMSQINELVKEKLE